VDDDSDSDVSSDEDNDYSDSGNYHSYSYKNPRGHCSVQEIGFNPFNPKYLVWHSPSLDLEHTIHV